MKIKNRYYFDFNATAPVEKEVLDWMSEEATPFANPSSVHSSGKKAKRLVSDTQDFLFSTFGLNENYFDCFFHSGATEGINTLLKGFCEYHKRQNQVVHFYFLETDHSCVKNLTEDLTEWGHKIFPIKVNSEGDFNEVQLAKEMQKNAGVNLVNFTWVNNESGVCQDLKKAEYLKEHTQCFIHVDAVQSIGKIANWMELSRHLDAYTFSGHKFGSLKGTGFSFKKNDFLISPLLRGGGQQGGIRSGTENTYGIYSLKIALEKVLSAYRFERQNEAKAWLENELLSLMGNKGKIAGHKAHQRNGNTIYFILFDTPAHTTSMALDMALMDVSNGSACSSGAVIPSRVLMAMGESEEHAKSAIRLSFSPYFDKEKAQEYWAQLEKVLKRFL